VHVGNADIEALIDDLKASERVSGRDDPEFVFLLQEAFRRSVDVPSNTGRRGSIPRRIQSSPNDIQALAAKLDWWMFYVPSMSNGEQVGDAAEDRGNAILSSMPLAELQAIELPFSVQRRVAIAAIVDDPYRALRFRVASLHLDTRAPLVRGVVLGASAARNRQAKWIVDAVNRFPADDVSLIIGGDLNSYWGPLESSIDTLAVVAPRMDCGTNTHTTGFTLDHMFARFTSGMSVASCRRAIDRFDSDHYPLVLALDQIPNQSASGQE
jgi:endonuclease/exonuclease/phosphatase family metal-dependent hydrolase